MSEPFNIERGVLQGDIFSPVCFIAGLDRIFRLYDHVNPGMTVGTGAHTVRMAKFEYADDAALIDEDAGQATARVTSLAWGYQSDRMFKLQKRAIRIVANSKYNAHTQPLFKQFRILKLSDVLILQTMKVYHKFRNKELPVYMKNWPLIINNEIHQYNTRIASDLHTFRYHHTFAKNHSDTTLCRQ